MPTWFGPAGDRLAPKLVRTEAIAVENLVEYERFPTISGNFRPGLTMAQTETKIVLVCQHTSCRKYGAAKVLAAFQDSPMEGVDVKGVAMLGKMRQWPYGVTVARGSLV